MSPSVPTRELRFDHPGWEDARFHEEHGALHFTWTMDDSSKRPGHGPVTVHTECRLDDAVSYAQAAWFCVRTAVLHEAGERFSIDGEHPFHPHHFKWWEREYKAGPAVLEAGS